jgi:hypothetical protein
MSLWSLVLLVKHLPICAMHNIDSLKKSKCGTAHGDLLYRSKPLLFGVVLACQMKMQKDIVNLVE